MVYSIFNPIFSDMDNHLEANVRLFIFHLGIYYVRLTGRNAINLCINLHFHGYLRAGSSLAQHAWSKCFTSSAHQQSTLQTYGLSSREPPVVFEYKASDLCGMFQMTGTGVKLVHFHK